MKKRILATVVLVLGISALLLGVWYNNYTPKSNSITKIVIYPLKDNLSLAYIQTDANENGLYGYVDKSGNVVIDFQFDDAVRFIGNMAWVKKDGLWGTIDKKGNIIIDFQYDYNYPLWVNVNGQRAFRMGKGDMYYYIDEQGNVIGNSKNLGPVPDWDGRID